MPSGGFLSPEAGLPFRNFHINGAKHDQNQPYCGALRQEANDHRNPAQQLSHPKKSRKAQAHPDTFCALARRLQVPVSTGDKDNAHHDAQQEQAPVHVWRKIEGHKTSIGFGCRGLLCNPGIALELCKWRTGVVTNFRPCLRAVIGKEGTAALLHQIIRRPCRQRLERRPTSTSDALGIKSPLHSASRPPRSGWSFLSFESGLE